MARKRVEFRLSMPSRGSWNGGWSGAGNNYVIYRSLKDSRIAELTGGENITTANFYHRWDDGWGANVTMRVMEPKERRQKSAGFSGYDWMVTNIILYGKTEKPELEPVEST